MRDYLVNEGQVPLDSCLILLPLQPELLAELLLGLFDVSVGQFPLLSLWGIKHNMEITIRPGKRDRAKGKPFKGGAHISHPCQQKYPALRMEEKGGQPRSSPNQTIP